MFLFQGALFEEPGSTGKRTVPPTTSQPAQQNKPPAAAKQQRSVPLGKLTDIELLRGCKIQLGQLAELKNNRGPLCINKETGQRFSQKAIDKARADVTRELENTVAEIERRSLDNKEIRAAVGSWKMGDYGAAMGFVAERLDAYGRSFLVKEKAKAAGQKAQLPSQKLRRVPIDILGLAAEVANAKDANGLLIEVLDFAAKQEWIDKQKDGRWTNEAELKKNITGDRLELVKEMLRYADANGADAMKKEFVTLKATDAAGALAEWKALLLAPKEAPGKQDAYVSIDAYLQDPRVILMDEQGGIKVKTDASGKYSVPETEKAYMQAAAAPETKVPPTDEAIEAGKELRALAGISGGNALSSMVAFGALQEKATRKELRQAGFGGSIAKAGNGKFYALSREYLGSFPVDGKNIAKRIAAGDVDYKPVQDIIRMEAQKRLKTLGVADDSDYMKGGKLDVAAVAALVEEKATPAAALVLAAPTLGALIAQQAKAGNVGFEETELYKAMLARCDDGNSHMDIAKFESLMASLKEANGAYKSGLKDNNGNLTVDAVMAAIGSATIAAPQQASAAGKRMFSPLRYDFVMFGPGPFGKTTTFYRDRYNAVESAVRALGFQNPLYYMARDGAMLPYYGEFGTPRQRRQPAPAEKQEAQQPAKQEQPGTAPAQQATEVQFSTGTWVDGYLNAAPPQTFLRLPREQQERVLMKLQQVVNKPENALVFDRKDAGDALLALDAAMEIIEDEDKK